MLRTLDPALDVLYAHNGEEALHVLHTQSPDLVFLDIVMPHYDGWHLLEYKNRDPAICDIPAIIVSAQDPLGQSFSRGTLITTMGEGIPRHKLLQCVCDLADLLMQSEPTPDQMPAEAPLVVPA